MKVKKIIALTAAFIVTASSVQGTAINAAEADETAISAEETLPEEAPVVKEEIKSFVNRLYKLVLGREPDKDGFENWTAQLTNGNNTAADVAYGFLFSGEYKDKNTTDKEYVEMLYNVMMDRKSDAEGTANWLKRLDEGFSRKYIFFNFVYSKEFSELCSSYEIKRGDVTLDENRDKNDNVTEFVQRLYRLCLDRKADIPGLNGWTGSLISKADSAADVVNGFISSGEYLSKNATDEEYIKMLYRVLMDRESDAEGMKNWLSCLDAEASRRYVYFGFLYSSEFSEICKKYGIERGDITLQEGRDKNIEITKFVQRLYKLCLGRKADIPGLNSWSESLFSKRDTAADVVNGFTASAEYTSKNTSDDEYVEMLYNMVLDRVPDAEGKQSWVERLKIGYTRKAVLRGFIESSEFTDLCKKYGVERGSLTVGGWATNDGMIYYYSPDSGMMVKGDSMVNGIHCYFDETGILRTDWSDLKTFVDTSNSVYSYNSMLSDVSGIQQQYPSLVNVKSIGVTADGRQIYDVIIGSGNADRQIVIQAGCHAREYTGSMLVMNQLEYYLKNYWSGSYNGVSYKELLDNCQVHIIPMLNPDGITISQYGLSGINSTSIRNNIMNIYNRDRSEGVTALSLNEYLRKWKANAVGVDINRNFDSSWASQNEIKRPSCSGYPGAYANSEAETQSVIRLVNSLSNIKSVISYHSSGSVIYWAYGQTGEFRASCNEMAKKLSSITGYSLLNGDDYGGGCSNWVAGKGIRAATIELGSGDSPLAQWQYNGIWNKNKDVLAYLMGMK